MSEINNAIDVLQTTFTHDYSCRTQGALTKIKNLLPISQTGTRLELDAEYEARSKVCRSSLGATIIYSELHECYMTREVHSQDFEQTISFYSIQEYEQYV